MGPIFLCLILGLSLMTPFLALAGVIINLFGGLPQLEYNKILEYQQLILEKIRL